MIRYFIIFTFLLCANAEANRIDVVGGGGGSGSVSDTVYGVGWDGDTTVAPSKNAVYDKIETIASGGDNISVNSTGATNANFLDNLYIDWAINTASTPDDITSKFNYAETLAGNPALLTTEIVFTADGLLAEGTTADTIEIKLAFPDPATTDKTITLPNATDTLVGKDTTDTLTNKTLAAASNVIESDTGDSATSFFSTGTLEVAIGGTGTTTSTGTGAVVLGTSPTIATPALTLQDGNGAAPTADGAIKYDRTAEVLQVGDGTITRSFPSSKIIAGFSITNGNTAIDATVTDPVACQRINSNSVVTGWYIDCDVSGSIVLDVWKNTWDDTPEVNGDSIAGTEKPTLSTDVSASDTALGSMTTDWNSGQNVCIEIESATTVTKCRVQFVGYLD